MSEHTFEHAVSDWLDSGSDRTPRAAIDAVLLAVKTTPQERGLRIPRRFNLMTFPMRLAAGIAIVAALGVAALSFTGRTLPPGGSLPPSPTPAQTSPDTTLATGPISTVGWVPYTSTRYGFTISHPDGWVEAPADHDWSLAVDADWRSTGAEAFVGAPLRVTAWSVAVEPGMTADAWIATYCPLSTGPCTSAGNDDRDVLVDGHAGSLIEFDTDTQAFFLVDDRMYVVAAWRPGSANYLEAFLSTVDLLPDGPAPAETRPPPTS